LFIYRLQYLTLDTVYAFNCVKLSVPKLHSLSKIFSYKLNKEKYTSSLILLKLRIVICNCHFASSIWVNSNVALLPLRILETWNFFLSFFLGFCFQAAFFSLSRLYIMCGHIRLQTLFYSNKSPYMYFKPISFRCYPSSFNKKRTNESRRMNVLISIYIHKLISNINISILYVSLSVYDH